MGKTVLVTGANGFTGSHLCRALVRRGDRVKALVRPTGDPKLLAGADIELVFGDLGEDRLPPDLLHGVDTVYHVAAVYRKEGVPRSYFFKVNVGGTERLLRAALEAGVGRFVHTSTVGVLGDIRNPPANEDAPYSPHDVYQESKLEAEKLALAFFQERGLPGVVIRPGAIYGPGDLRFLKLFKGIERGLFWMIGTGENFYHLVYVDDLVQGYLLAGDRTDLSGETFIIAGEAPVQVKDLVTAIGQALGRPVKQRRVPVGPVMVTAKVVQAVCRPLKIEPPLYPRRLDFFIANRSFSIEKARQMLGYQPQVDLKTGLACTAAWYRQQGLL